MTEPRVINRRLWPPIARFCWRWRWAIVVVALAGSLASGLLASRLRLDADLISLLPEETHSVTQLRRVLEKTGGFGDLMVMIESPEPAANRTYARDLLPALEKLEWVEHATYGQDPSFFRRHGLLYMSLADLRQLLNNLRERIRHEELRLNPFYVELDEEPAPEVLPPKQERSLRELREGGPFFESDDGRILLLVVSPRGLASDLTFARRVDRELRALIAAQDPAAYHDKMRISIGGTFANRLDEYRTVTGDVKASALVAGTGILLLLAIHFRRLLALPLLALPLAMSLSWTFALAQLAIGSLNIITVFLIVVLFGLGIDFGIHMLSRFLEERRRGAPAFEAAAAMLEQAGRPALIAALTTASAFAMLMFTHFRGFSELGFIAATGLLFAAVAFVFVLPALLAIVANAGLTMLPRSGAVARPLVAPSPLRRPRLLLAIAGAVTVAALALLPRTGFEYDLRRLRSPSPETRELNRKMRLVFPLPRDPAVVWVETEKEAAAVAAAAKRTSSSVVQEAQSIHDLVPSEQPEKLEVIAELKELALSKLDLAPEKVRAELLPLLREVELTEVAIDDLPAQMKRPFTGRPGTAGQLVYIYQSESVMDLREALRFSEAIREIRAGGRVYYPASEPLVFADILRVLHRDVPLALGLSLLAVTVLLFAIARRPLSVATIGSPLVLGVIWMFGVMAALGLRFNILNIVVLPTILGLGIDSGVHLFHRSREEGTRGMNRVLRRTGVASAVCTMTSVIGFGGMVAATHPGLRSIGILAVIGLTTCLVAALLFLPALFSVSPRLQGPPERSIGPLEGGDPSAAPDSANNSDSADSAHGGSRKSIDSGNRGDDNRGDCGGDGGGDGGPGAG